MKKVISTIMLVIMTFCLMGCSTKSSWARVEPIGETGNFLFTSMDGDISIYKEDGTIIFQANNLGSDAQYEIYEYGVSYISKDSRLFLVSGITGQKRVVDNNVTFLNGVVYSKKIDSGVLVMPYEVDETGAIVSVNKA